MSAGTATRSRVTVPDAAVTAVRLALAALIIAAVGATFLETAGRSAINPFNFFGYFTIQSNLLMAAVWAWVAVARGGQRSRPVADHVRGIITTYVVIVGVVYATLLAPLGVAGGVPVPWANTVLHVLVPIVAAVDWICIGDRGPLRWRWLPAVLSYPLIWIGVVLIRGATDGWVPYPFLDPDLGYGTVGVTVLAISAVTLIVGAAMFALSRSTLLSVRRTRRTRRRN